MSAVIAHKTMQAIDDALEADQGASFRLALKVLLPKMEDAYRGLSDRHRSHFGFSSAGESCARKLYYSWRWCKASIFPAKVLRLFNRGHLEEARFLAMLQACGFQVHFETSDGGQFKISDHSGHAGSALDGVVVGIPDLPPDTPCLAEMKTHNQANFNKVARVGMKESHYKHYVQMQIYMHKYKLKWGLYMAVNKNTDELILELIYIDEECAQRYIDRCGAILYSDKKPDRVNNSPGWYECKFCNYKAQCHNNEIPEINCRTCIHSQIASDKKWYCSWHDKEITKKDQLAGCGNHLFNPELLNDCTMLQSNPDEGWLRITWDNRKVTLGVKDGVQRTTSQGLKDKKYV